MPVVTYVPKEIPSITTQPVMPAEARNVVNEEQARQLEQSRRYAEATWAYGEKRIEKENESAFIGKKEEYNQKLIEATSGYFEKTGRDAYNSQEQLSEAITSIQLDTQGLRPNVIERLKDYRVQANGDILNKGALHQAKQEHEVNLFDASKNIENMVNGITGKPKADQELLNDTLESNSKLLGGNSLEYQKSADAARQYYHTGVAIKMSHTDWKGALEYATENRADLGEKAYEGVLNDISVTAQEETLGSLQQMIQGMKGTNAEKLNQIRLVQYDNDKLKQAADEFGLGVYEDKGVNFMRRAFNQLEAQYKEKVQIDKQNEQIRKQEYQIAKQNNAIEIQSRVAASTEKFYAGDINAYEYQTELNAISRQTMRGNEHYLYTAKNVAARGVNKARENDKINTINTAIATENITDVAVLTRTMDDMGLSNESRNKVINYYKDVRGNSIFKDELNKIDRTLKGTMSKWDYVYFSDAIIGEVISMSTDPITGKVTDSGLKNMQTNFSKVMSKYEKGDLGIESHETGKAKTFWNWAFSGDLPAFNLTPETAKIIKRYLNQNGLDDSSQNIEREYWANPTGWDRKAAGTEASGSW